MLPVYLIHWNAPEWLASSVASVRNSDLDVALHVVHNGPSDVSLDHIGDDVAILTMPTNEGYTGGANRAIREWLGGCEPFAVIASHDLHVEPDTLRRMVEAMEHHPDLGIIGPTVRPAGMGELVGQRADLELRTWVSGTCLLVRRECALDVGWFDEDYGSYVEDVDYCLRTNDAGWRVGRLLSAEARGLGSGTDTSMHAIHKNWIVLDWKRNGWLGGTRRALKLAKKAVRHTALSLVPSSNQGARRQRAAEYRSGVVQGVRRVWGLRRRT